HRELGAAFLERRLELLDEQALAADLGQRAIEDLVAAGRHAQQLDLHALLLQQRLHVLGLPESEAALAGRDDDALTHPKMLPADPVADMRCDKVRDPVTHCTKIP